MALPLTRLVLGSISEILSTFGDFVIWTSSATVNPNQSIILLFAGLILIYILLVLIVEIFVPIGRILRMVIWELGVSLMDRL